VETIKASPLGDVALPKLTAQQINGFYRERLAAGNSPTTVRHYHRILSGALRFVEDEEWINWGGRSPASKATPPPSVDKEAYDPTVDEVLRLIHAAETSRQPPMADFIRLGALTGMRRGEVCGLRWIDIDWDKALIFVRRSVYQIPGQVGVKLTKNKRSKRVDLGVAGLYLLACLRDRAAAEAKEASVELSVNGYVFSKVEDGSVPWTPNSVTQFTTRLRDRLDLPEFHFHSLRHWSGSELVEAGIDIRNVAGRLGHTDGGVLLLNRYAHRSNEQDRKSAEVLGQLLGLPSGEVTSPRTS
jgi:integrase